MTIVSPPCRLGSVRLPELLLISRPLNFARVVRKARRLCSCRPIFARNGEDGSVEETIILPVLITLTGIDQSPRLRS